MGDTAAFGQYERIVQQVCQLSKEAAPYSAWHQSHCARIYGHALEIARLEGIAVDPVVLILASYLHSFGSFDKYREIGVGKSVRSAQIASQILQGENLAEEKTRLVVKVIEGHEHFATPDTSCAEAVVFHDANALSFLGSGAIMMMHGIAGRGNGAKNIDECNATLLRYKEQLPKSIITKSGQAIATQKVREMEHFFSYKGGKRK
ncbi:hypothetical protein FJZ26_04885 [Candidatus Parvarchaeota archaeon]|nr:hypothetical protein [Candidatus Parvarchaeota archaeon]